MIQSVESRTFEKLNITTDLLLTLSQFFAKGGEQLEQTLGPLTHAVTTFAENNGANHLFPEVQNLALFSRGDCDEYETLKFEFNRLFVGPLSPKAPPYESVYRSPDRLVMQEQTIAVRTMYSREQLLATDRGSEPDDFIGTELEFMAYLLSRVIHAGKQNKTTQATYYLDFYNEFCSKHTQLWWEDFAQTIEEATTHPVFLAVSKVLRTLTKAHYSVA